MTTMRGKYPSRKKNEYTVEERKLVLELIAQAERNADPRYVMDAIDWMWQQVLDRKLRKLETRNTLPRIQRQRLTTLAELYS